MAIARMWTVTAVAGRGARSSIDIRVVTAIVTVTGATALVMQTVWYRLLSLHAGIDMTASTTVVAAFLLGLGAGSLIGGRVADRIRAHDAFAVLALLDVGIALYVLASVFLLNDLYRDLVGIWDSPVSTFLFNVLVLLVPTLLMGMSLPMITRAVVGDVRDAGSIVGRLGSFNTFGAAFGAALGGWFLIGTFGLTTVTRIVAVAHVAVAACFAIIWRQQSSRASVAGPHAGPAEHPNVETETGPAGDEGVDSDSTSDGGVGVGVGDGAREEPGGGWPPRRWYLIYAVTGATALGLQQVFFRVVDAVMRSNAYTFGHVLFLYLGCWAIGAAVGSRLVRRPIDLRRWFLWLLFGAGLGSLVTITLLIRVVPQTPLASVFYNWFSSEGFGFGFFGKSLRDRLLFGLATPMFVMGVPVGLFGAAFPVAQALVSSDLRSLGRATGRLQYANLMGSVVGTLLTGFVLIDHFGSAGTLKVLAIPTLAAGLVAAGYSRRVNVVRGAVAAFTASMLAVSPSNQQLWSNLIGLNEFPEQVLVAEDRSCAAALKLFGEEGAGLVINGRGQNTYPFDDFHVMIGMLPALSHPDPERAIVIGFGIGATTFGIETADRVPEITNVEICGGTYELADRLADRGRPEFEAIRADDSHRRRVGDGRTALQRSSDDFDLIVPDTLVPTSAGSNNVYSLEFFELANSRLSDDGLLAIWSATPRVANAATTTFPYVERIAVGDGDMPPEFMLASRSPIDLDPERLVERFEEIPSATFSDEQRSSLRAKLGDLRSECLTDGRRAAPPDGVLVNRDLRPLDKYFLNGDALRAERVVRSCRSE